MGLSDAGDLIFEAVGETAVEDVAECAIAIAAVRQSESFGSDK